MAGLEDLRAEMAALRGRVEVAEAVLAVQALKAAYAELVDRRFARGRVVGSSQLEGVVAEIVELFTEDAVWDGGPRLGVATGRIAIADRLRSPTLTFSRHLFTNPRIRVSPPTAGASWTAAATWDLLCPCRTPDGRSWWMCGYEEDEYRREAGEWRCTSVRLTTLFMVEAGAEFDRILA